MPKIRDLGIKVIPETMQPPGIGGGAGCGCTNFTNCIGCTQNLTIGCDPGPSPCIGGTPCLQTNCQPTHCLPTHPCLPTPNPCLPTHPCLPTPNPCVPTHGCLPTPCLCTNQSCHGCTQFPQTPCLCSAITCHGCSIHPFPTVCHVPTVCIAPTVCGCSALGSLCQFQTQGGGGCGPASPVCAGSIDPTITILQQGGLTQEHINTLKDQLQKQIQALDEHAKTIGPKTSDEIDAREKQLNEELAQLKTRRKELDKK